MTNTISRRPILLCYHSLINSSMLSWTSWSRFPNLHCFIDSFWGVEGSTLKCLLFLNARIALHIKTFVSLLFVVLIPICELNGNINMVIHYSCEKNISRLWIRERISFSTYSLWPVPFLSKINTLNFISMYEIEIKSPRKITSFLQLKVFVVRIIYRTVAF